VRRAILVLLGAGAAALAGCGDARTPPPDMARPAAPTGYKTVRFAALGLALRRVPANWLVQGGQPPLVATISSGTATLAVWRYPRTQPLPRTHAELKRALGALLAAVSGRPGNFRALRARVTRVAHQPALMLLGVQTIDGNERETRSAHVYAYGSELVLDAYAPAAWFAAADRGAFVPIVRSLALRKP
jgi:hypothetical protein